MLSSFFFCHWCLVGCVADAEALRLEICAQHREVLCPVVPAHTLQCKSTNRRHTAQAERSAGVTVNGGSHAPPY
jgi:hypothetical protein